MPYLQLLLSILYQGFIAIVSKTVVFPIFRDYNLFCNKKLLNIILGLCIYFFQKPVKMILENHSLKRFWIAYDTLCHLVYTLICITWF